MESKSILQVKKCNVFQPTNVKHKRSRGELSEKKLKFYQSQSDCVYFAKSGIEAVVRENMQDYTFGIGFSPEALGIIQIALESYLIRLIEKAVLLIIYSEKKIVTSKEIQLVIEIQEKKLI